MSVGDAMQKFVLERTSMSQKQGTQYKGQAANAYGSIRRQSDKDSTFHSEKIVHTNSVSDSVEKPFNYRGVSNHLISENINPENCRLAVPGLLSQNKGGAAENISNDRLILLTLLLVGQPVEVHLKTGSIYSGVFHTANVEEDYGVVLKMARLVKDGSQVAGKETNRDHIQKPPMKTFIILAKDLVQVIAKDIPLTGDMMEPSQIRGNKHDLLTDSVLAQGRYIEVERELKPWTPDDDVPQNANLDNTFDNTRNRHWDQFETNKSLFGIESTFDEELYTTKLERGPQMKELELKASQLAREIENKKTRNFHLAEERGIYHAIGEDLQDEESRFSSVLRLEDISEDNEDKSKDVHNEETFGASFSCTEDASTLSRGGLKSNSVGVDGDSKNKTVNHIGVLDSSYQDSPGFENTNAFGGINLLSAEESTSNFKLSDDGNGFINLKKNSINECAKENTSFSKQSFPDDNVAGIVANVSEEVAHSTDTTTSSTRNTVNVSKQSTKATVSPSASQTSSTEQASLLSKESSTEYDKTSTTSKKSSLNPNAKEFKLNPNAKSFTPVFGGARQASSAAQAPVYVSGSVSAGSGLTNLVLGHGTNSAVQQTSQPAKLAQYNTLASASGVTAPTVIQPVANFVSRGATLQPILSSQSTDKVSHSGQQVLSHSLAAQSIRYGPSPSVLNQASAYIVPNNQLYPQHIAGQTGQVVYVQHYPNEMLQGSHINASQGSVAALVASHPAQVGKLRGHALHGMQYIVAAPLVSGQQPYIQSAPISQFANSLQPSRNLLIPANISGMQVPQGIGSGPGTNGGHLIGNNGVWLGGKASGGHFQQ